MATRSGQPTIVAAFALALSGLLATTLVVTLSSVVHRSLFELVPADGLVSLEQRVTLDTAITAYLADGQVERLSNLTAAERAHLAEVRSLILAAVVALLVLVGISWRLGLTYQRLELAIVLVLIGAAALTVSFQASFYQFHELVFHGAPWIFDPSQYLLTQLYPLGFFQAAWISAVVATVALLSLWSQALTRIARQHREAHVSA